MQQDDWALAKLDEKDRALLDFARKLNDEPGKMCRDDIARLRAAGFTDQNTFDAVVLVAYFNFMNRIADGFGVEPEPEKVQSNEGHLRELTS